MALGGNKFLNALPYKSRKMHSLITKYFNKNITAEEKAELFSLMQTDKELHKEFVFMQNLCALSASLPVEDDEVKAVGKLIQFKEAHKREKKKFAGLIRHLVGYAAAICMAVISTWAIMNNRHDNAVEEQLAFEEFSTPPGQRAQVKLHDGTVVWLNARSRLRYPNRFSGTERKVELDGEAFFEVFRNEEVPFVVSTEKLDIKVLGTKFNVFAYKGNDEFITALIEGSVKLYQSDNEAVAMYMSPNDYAELKDGRLVKSKISSTDFLLWKEGIYAFDDIPFGEIIKKLELYYDITIEIRNKNLNNYKFSGKFRQRDGIESVLKTLQKIYYFSFVKDEELNKITIR